MDSDVPTKCVGLNCGIGIDVYMFSVHTVAPRIRKELSPNADGRFADVGRRHRV